MNRMSEESESAVEPDQTTEPCGVVFDDPEIDGMRIILETLEPFNEVERSRMLWYVRERLGIRINA